MSLVAVPPPTVPEHFPDIRHTKALLYDSGNATDAFYPASSATLKSSSGVSGRSNTEYLGSKYPRDPRDQLPEGHEYLEVDVLSRIRSLQNEIELLRGSVHSGSDSSKAKEASIYEKIDSVKRRRQSGGDSGERRENGLFAFLFTNAKSRGLFRLSNLCDPSYTYCRFIWLLVITLALGITSYQIFDRVRHYQSTPRRHYVDTYAKEELKFPTVTICNLNTFRLSKVADLGVYNVIHTLQHDRPSPPSRVVNFTQLRSHRVREFMRATAHRTEDFIYRCQWQSNACGVVNFTTVFTGRENCVSFDLQLNQGFVKLSGSHSGLYLVLNIEQYEYILGPTSAVGAKIAVHDKSDRPKSFVHIPVGKLTSIEISKVQHEFPRATGLEKILNLRSKWTLPDNICSYHCREVAVRAECGCTLSLDSSPKEDRIECTMTDWFSCVQGVIDRDQCGCSNHLQDNDYQMSLSYAAIPKYGIESELRSFKDRAGLEKKFRRSLDLYHTYDTVMMSYDNETLEKILVELTRGTNETRALTELTTVYSLTFKEKAGELRDTFVRMKINADKHYLYFDASSHISFTSVTKLLQNAINYVLSKESAALSASRTSMLAVVLEQILGKMDDIVIVDKSTDTRSDKTLITEIDEGLNAFREIIIDGYGQSYKELRVNRSVYDKITLAMKNITHVLRKTLINEYGNIRRIKDNLNINEDVRFEIRSIFIAIRSLAKKEMEDLMSMEEKLITIYRRDKLSILKSINVFVQMIDEFANVGETMNAVIVGINRTSSLLYAKIQEAESRLRFVTDKYKLNKYGKSEYSERMNDERLKGGFNQVKESAKVLASNVDDLRDKSKALSQTIQHTTNIEFSQFRNNKTKRTLAWLRQSSLAERVDMLLGHIDETLRNVEEYQKELKEYTASRRVNEAFYKYSIDENSRANLNPASLLLPLWDTNKMIVSKIRNTNERSNKMKYLFFMLNNFLNLDIYFKDLSVTIKSEYISYTLIDLTCDIGSTLALYLGASVLTIIQLVEFIHATSRYVLSNKHH